MENVVFVHPRQIENYEGRLEKSIFIGEKGQVFKLVVNGLLPPVKVSPIHLLPPVKHSWSDLSVKESIKVKNNFTEIFLTFQGEDLEIMESCSKCKKMKGITTCPIICRIRKIEDILAIEKNEGNTEINSITFTSYGIPTFSVIFRCTNRVHTIWGKKQSLIITFYDPETKTILDQEIITITRRLFKEKSKPSNSDELDLISDGEECKNIETSETEEENETCVEKQIYAIGVEDTDCVRIISRSPNVKFDEKCRVYCDDLLVSMNSIMIIKDGCEIITEIKRWNLNVEEHKICITGLNEIATCTYAFNVKKINGKKRKRESD